MIRPLAFAMTVGAGVLALGVSGGARAQQAAERELLGVRLWRDYATVLKRHGEPTRVVPGIALPPEFGAGSINVTMQPGQRGGAFMPGAPMAGTSMGLIGPPTAPMMGGMASPGGMTMPGMAGGPRSLGMGAGMTAPGGMMPGGPGRFREEDDDGIGTGAPELGVGGPRGAMSGPRPFAGGMTAPMAGMSGPPPGAMGGPMMGGMGGITAPSYGAGLRAMSGLTGPSGMMGTGMAASTPGSVGAQSQLPAYMPSEDVKETWVYERGGHTYYFMFNQDGRVIRIQSFGLRGPGATSRAISLGDPISKVYAKYGWAGRTLRQGDSVTLDYSQKYHVVFDLVDRRDGKGLRVVGITIAPSEGR